MFMEGPLVEYHPVSLPVDWNGGIAYLDRDGVLNLGSANYVNNVDEVLIFKGVSEAIMSLRNAGYRIVIVTNQSPLSRGLLDQKALESIHSHIQDLVGEFDVIMTCPHRTFDGCRCRKPHPGMLNSASELLRGVSHKKLDWWGEKPIPLHPLDLMVGDRKSDMGAGWAVGARLFKVDERVGIPQIIDRIIAGDAGDLFDTGD
jgi:HAD superfamily hydrolase (TIGR01662 family)